jgi:aminoglycoside 6'-N-acetyltransferase I
MSIPPPNLEIRPADPSDRGEWLRMRQALWPEGTVAEHAAEIDAFLRGSRSGEEVWVAELSRGELCGFLALAIRSHAEGCKPGNVPYIEGWWIEPGKRGYGIGGALVATVEAWAAANGYDEIASDTQLENAGGLAAHLALGFEEVERAIHFRKRIDNSN